MPVHPMTPLWIIGEAHVDFAQAIRWLQSRAACRFFADPASALNELRIAKAGAAAAMILLQTRSGQIGEADVEKLHSAAPLTPLLCLSGPWCEGEARSGRPLAGVTSIAWRAWRERLPREWAALMHANGAPTRLPRTASETERIETSLARIAKRGCYGRTAIVCTTSRTTFQAIGDLLGQWGMTAQWRRAANGSPLARGDLLICDGWRQVPPTDDAVRPPVLLLLHFPRPEDELRAQSVGIAAALAQPLLLADLAAAIDNVLASRCRPPGGISNC